MKPSLRAVFLFAVTGLVLSPVAGTARERGIPGGRPGAGTANPSALVAKEIAFNRMAREKGQWEAFRKLADDDAVLFVPQPVRAKDWLMGRREPATTLQWEASKVWMSCDGTLGVTTGNWTRSDGKLGYFTTIWKKTKKGDYRWVLDQGDEMATATEQPEFLSAVVADCPAPHGPGGPPPASEEEIVVTAPGPEGQGVSKDGTLRWRYAVADDMSRTITITIKRNGANKDIVFTAAAHRAD